MSDLARQAGSGRLVWRDVVVNHATLNMQLRVYIYADQTLTDLARPSLVTAVVVLIAGLLIAIPKDVRWSRSRRHGRRLKGPELLSVRQFNRRTRADGIRFMQTPPWSSKMLGLQPALAIPRVSEVPGWKGQEKHWRHLRQSDETERQRRMRAFVELPAHGHGQHLLPERGNQSSDQIEEEIPITEDGIGMVCRAGFFAALVRGRRFTHVGRSLDAHCNVNSNSAG